MKSNIDKELEKTKSFRNVVTSVVSKLFQFDHDIPKIYVDVNSCVSILFRYEDINESDIVQRISDIIETFLMNYLNKKTEIILLFTLEESQAHVTIDPNWCKDRMGRVQLVRCEFIKQLMVSLSQFSKENPFVKVIQTHKVHPALVVLEQERKTRKPFCVLSKDVVFQCMRLSHMSVYTGVHYIEIADPLRVLPDDITLSDPEIFLPYYLAIRGDRRNEWRGVEGYGKVTTLKYLQQHKLAIKADLEHPLKEHCDKYCILFDPNKLMLENKEPIPTI